MPSLLPTWAKRRSPFPPLSALPLALGLDGFARSLRQQPVIRRLTSQVRGAALQISVRVTETSVGRDGEMTRREVDQLQHFAAMNGRRLIDPGELAFAPQLEAARERLSQIVAASADEDVKAMDDPGRRAFIRKFNDGIRIARQAFSEIHDARRFLRPENIAALRSWGRHEGALFPLFIARQPVDTLRVGSDEQSAVALPIPMRSAEEGLPALPKISADLDSV
jgi:hypothetical protein